MIPWYMEDNRFKPGTVADIGYSIRLTLEQMSKHTPEGRKPISEFRLYLRVRTLKADGAKDGLRMEARVATFKKCQTLQDAQERAEIWFSRWRCGLF